MEPGFRHVKLIQHQPQNQLQLLYNSRQSSLLVVGNELGAGTSNESNNSRLSPSSSSSSQNCRSSDNGSRAGSVNNSVYGSVPNEASSASNRHNSSSPLMVISPSSEGNVGQQVGLISDSSTTGNQAAATTGRVSVPATSHLTDKRLSNGTNNSSSNPTSCSTGNNSNKGDSTRGVVGGESSSNSGNISNCVKRGMVIGTDAPTPTSMQTSTGVTSVIVENFSSLAVTQQQQQLSPGSSNQTPRLASPEGKAVIMYLQNLNDFFAWC